MNERRGDGGGGDGGGLNLSELSLPRSGPAAINALKPFASQLLEAVGSVGQSISDMADGDFPTSFLSPDDVSSVAGIFSNVFQHASALAAAGENIELSSFGQKEREDVLKMQDGLRNLGGLLKLDHIDITRFITRPQSGFVNFQRIAAQFAVGGAITMTVGVSLDYIIHYHNNGNGYSIGGHGNQHTTATTATESISTAEPKSWLLNTVPGTSREAFEDFVSKLPDRGSGRRIVYPHMNHQYYVAKLTLEEANAVSKLTIVDQLGSNERIRFDPWCEELPWRAQWRNRLERRANHCVINRAISCRSHRLTNSI